MKGFLRSIFISLLTIYITDLIFIGFTLANSLQVLITAAIVLTLLNKLVRPIIKLLLLPINLITLGLFRWVVSVLTLVLLQILVVGIDIKAFFFPGLEYNGFIIPSFAVSLLASYILTSIILRAVSSSIRWILAE